LKKLLRYGGYFTVAFKYFLKRKNYDYIIGWQQFYTNILAFYCRLFHVQKSGTIVSMNFTYKKKNGFIGKLYHKFMCYSLNNDYIDYLHVPSEKYAERCSKELGINLSKFIVTTFGIPDTFDNWTGSKVTSSDYTLSIGRSNRDFDFLMQVFADEKLQEQKLILISDTYKPTIEIPSNVTIYDDIKGPASMPWIANADLLIIPIDDGNIASGDTVLLTGMMFEKTVVITKPSTLAEMYIKDGENGVAINKNVEEAADKIAKLLSDKATLDKIGKNARQSYLKNFSRLSLGKQVGAKI
jgi:glycosyltransferase involved in cell wall biosynthesis